MSNQPMNNKNIDALLKASNGKLDRKSVEAAAKGDADALLSKLGEEDRRKITNILNDKQALQKILSSDVAKQMLDKLSGNGKK